MSDDAITRARAVLILANAMAAPKVERGLYDIAERRRRAREEAEREVTENPSPEPPKAA